MLKSLQLLTVLALTLFVTACGTTGQVGNCYGAYRFRAEIIDQLNREEAQQILTHNEREAAKGCAVRNQ